MTRLTPYLRGTILLLLFLTLVVQMDLLAAGTFTGSNLPEKDQKILPRENSVLNYRLVGFSTSSSVREGKYLFEIAAGYYANEDSFKKNIIKTLSSETSRVIGEVPSFGSQYTWRATSSSDHPEKSELHRFSTSFIPNVDTGYMRLRLLEPATTYKDAYVFSDGNKVMYDMSGKPIWYLPNIEGLMNEHSWVRDMKLTPQGTITFIMDDHHIYEVNYDGDILWKGPENGGDDEDRHYHHEFSRLTNGHYMALGSEPKTWSKKEPTPGDKSIYTIGDYKKQAGDDGIMKYAFETLTEYDARGEVTWKWALADYFKRSDLFFCKPGYSKQGFDVRVNAFYFDEQTKTIYLSFKNISRVIRISYPDGKVVSTYGEVFKANEPQTGNPLFCHQHSCRRSQSGNMYLFNNGCDVSVAPKISIFKEPGKGPLKKVWEYECSFDGTEHKALSAAGNVFELPDSSIFVCMGTPYSKLFIVSMDKKILWSALPEVWEKGQKKWVVNPQYRASIITDRHKIERLVWNGTTGN